MAAGRSMPMHAWNENATKVVDLRGFCIDCTGPMLYVKQALCSLPLGGTLELVSSTEGTRDDIAYWANRSGQEYLGSRLDQGVDHIFLRRRK